MTRERAKEWLPLMVAYANGKQIQYRPLSNPEHEWRDTETPQWSEFTEYRIKPEPKLRPWKREEVPLDAWFRNKKHSVWFKLISISHNDVGFISINDGFSSATFEHLLETAEHSIDGGKTWLPCGVMEDVK
jgi:hypothetical protein